MRSEGTADKALENIAQATTLAFSDAYEGDARPSSVSILVPRLQLLLEALEQGHTGDAQRVGVFTDNLSLEIARKAVNYIKCSLFDNGGPDGLATEDYPKMLASLLTTRGQRLMRDLAFAEVSSSGRKRCFRLDVLTTHVVARVCRTSFFDRVLP